ncbi:MAG: hypothetical protein M1828_000672 [Chrysothrix sp. TS-e1954]|nr:MAG: hypothetical protein M1828_000672 [Chrysothrix sp. TS-e1954]
MSSPRHAVIGPPNGNFWLHSSNEGFDLTHPSSPSAQKIYPRIPLQTTTAQVTVDPAKTALVVVDMQNFFLSENLGRPKDGNGMKACDKLLRFAIPACRKAGIRIIWLNWGLTVEDIELMPPATLRAFGFQTVPTDKPVESKTGREAAVDDHGVNANAEETARKCPPEPPFGRNPRLYKGLGSDVGPVQLDDGSTVQGGRLLMRDQWNSQLQPALEEARQRGVKGMCEREDVWIHKNRMSGLWGGETPCTKYLEANGIRSLLFAGVNTDQCVGGSLQDAFTKGYDCFLLSDGCGTTSPDHSQQCVEFNSAKTWGFVLSCEDLAKGAENMVHA